VVASRLRLAEALEQRGHAEDLLAAAEHRGKAEELAETLGVAMPIGASASDSAPPSPVTLIRQGRRWRVEVGSRAVVVDHSVGMLHLAVLTANPGVEIAAVELVAGVDGLTRAARGGSVSTQTVLDRSAVQRYRARLTQLADEIDDAETRDDTAAADRARGEREWIVAELAASTGLGGRARAFSDDGERARLAVGKAIRRALVHIEGADPVIGAQLRAGIHTGVRCWYRPL
jgi:hypothetical protein